MKKKYYADVYFYNCKNCKKQVLGKFYFGVFDLAEIGAAKQSGLLIYTCTHCRTSYKSDSMSTNGEVVEVSPEEALSNGLAFDSKGLA